MLSRTLDKLTTNFLSETITVRCLKILLLFLKRGKRTTLKIVRYNNLICHDYRRYRRKAKLGCNTGSNGNGDEQPQLIHTMGNESSRANIHRDNHESEVGSPLHKQTDHWRNHRHTKSRQNPIGQTTAKSERGNVENIDNLHN